MSRAPFEFRLSVLGLDEVNHVLPSSVSHVVSLIDPGTELPRFFQSLGNGRHLVIEVHDVLDSNEGKRAPTREDALALCRYADALDGGHMSHLIVHCHMGRSRSAAAAAILLVRLGYSPTEAFRHVRATRDPIWPNWTLLEHGDDVLDCGGELCQACRDVYWQIREAFPKWVEDPCPETIDNATLILPASSRGNVLGVTRENEYAPAIKSALALDHDTYKDLGEAQVRAQLQTFARSTKIDVDQDQLRVVLRGTDLGHHRADPHLTDNVRSLPAPVIDGDYAAFRARLHEYDLCMEDSWTGYFASRCLQSQMLPEEPVVFVHLDDHTDMMPTLLTLTPDGLRDPHTCQIFDPAKPADWESAIRSGAIGIGSFVTALYYLPQTVHVMHLNHVASSHYKRYAVVPRKVTQRLLPHAQFAGIGKQTRESIDQLGTYTGGADAAHLLRSVPQGRLIVHIDLDYFINDYNGNLGTKPAMSVDELRDNASKLMEKFFDELAPTSTMVERWIIATSPGFCSARHWDWLLNALSTYIKNQSID